jgi:ABC-type glycerol-3-phosphate transport system substrate-binding protein
MTSPEAQVNLAQGGEVPSRKSTYRNPWFATPEAQLIKEWSEFMGKYGRTRRFPATWPDLAQILAEECQGMFLKGVTPKDAIAAAVSRFNKIVEKA